MRRSRGCTTGPVVRITPDEIHLSDPENYERIYFVGSKYSKSADFYRAFSSNSAAFTTPSNEAHRVRRAALNPFFSRKMVLELEDVVQSNAQNYALDWRTRYLLERPWIFTMDLVPCL